MTHGSYVTVCDCLYRNPLSLGTVCDEGHSLGNDALSPSSHEDQDEVCSVAIKWRQLNNKEYKISSPYASSTSSDENLPFLPPLKRDLDQNRSHCAYNMSTPLVSQLSAHRSHETSALPPWRRVRLNTDIHTCIMEHVYLRADILHCRLACKEFERLAAVQLLRHCDIGLRCAEHVRSFRNFMFAHDHRTCAIHVPHGGASTESEGKTTVVVPRRFYFLVGQITLALGHDELAEDLELPRSTGRRRSPELCPLLAREVASPSRPARPGHRLQAYGVGVGPVSNPASVRGGAEFGSGVEVRLDAAARAGSGVRARHASVSALGGEGRPRGPRAVDAGVQGHAELAYRERRRRVARDSAAGPGCAEQHGEAEAAAYRHSPLPLRWSKRCFAGPWRAGPPDRPARDLV
ncbi:hypothetical protein C8Q74DRAFT_1307668 [Fomes fomentarius]|nr:hypothetical protein C8Q74DRAFT_1307668 [Fomes fomentarius]